MYQTGELRWEPNRNQWERKCKFRDAVNNFRLRQILKNIKGIIREETKELSINVKMKRWRI